MTEIPVELLIYTEVYEKRLPKDPELRELIVSAREAWRNEFANTRRANYLALSSVDSQAAEQLWLEKQVDNPWIFGPNPVPLSGG